MSTAPKPAPEITTREIVEGVVVEIQRRRTARFDADDGQYQRKNPIASDIDPDSCKRRQVLAIVKWDEAKPFGNYLKARFETGRLLEREAGRELAGLGFEIIHQQVRFELKSRKTGATCLSGKIDGKIDDAIEIPFETKSLHTTQYAGVNTVEDLLRHPWYRKYVFQMLAYLIGHGLEVGFFWLTDCLGHWKAIVVEIDYEAAERLWTFAEEIVDAVEEYRKDETLPPFTEDQAQCLSCAFFGRSCQPEIQHEGIVMYQNGVLEQKLLEREELVEIGKEYKSVDAKIKKWLKDFETDEKLKGKDLVVIGDFIIEFTDRHRKGFTVEPTDYRQASIRRIDHEETKLVGIETGKHGGAQ